MHGCVQSTLPSLSKATYASSLAMPISSSPSPSKSAIVGGRPALGLFEAGICTVQPSTLSGSVAPSGS